MLWVDKHRPKTLDGLDYHKPLATNMKRMVASGDFPHMLFYGPSGAGKKTRVMALLRQLHGPSVEKLKVEARTFKFGSSSTTTDLTMVTSSHHIELNPSDAGIRDRCARAPHTRTAERHAPDRRRRAHCNLSGR
jgi:replication factor C subunit 3/5